MGNRVQKFYSIGGKVIVNTTVTLEDSPMTRDRNVKTQLQRHMIQVIQSHANNIGESALGVEGPLNPIPQVSGNSLLNFLIAKVLCNSLKGSCIK